jgi:hypothetical protein
LTLDFHPIKTITKNIFFKFKQRFKIKDSKSNFKDCQASVVPSKATETTIHDLSGSHTTHHTVFRMMHNANLRETKEQGQKSKLPKIKPKNA